MYTTKLLIFNRNRNISLFGAFYHLTLTFHENKFQKSVKAFLDTLTITTTILLLLYYYYYNSLSGATFCANYVKFSRMLTFRECSLLGVLPLLAKDNASADTWFLLISAYHVC